MNILNSILIKIVFYPSGSFYSVLSAYTMTRMGHFVSFSLIRKSLVSTTFKLIFILTIINDNLLETPNKAYKNCNYH